MKANQLQKLLEDKKGFANLVPMVLAVIIVFALLFIGAYINGTIQNELSSSIGSSTGVSGLADQDRSIENDTKGTMNNTSGNWDSTLNIVQVVVIITILAAAIGAIFLFTRFR
ncbi:unnamed protein product [marine sediment metagenome]|uniref:Uncharacterized protein n=1 Tax=marine sediment metagenome TaxID=412755 RepID=X1CZT3_9ZZZZ